MNTASTCPQCSPELAEDIWRQMERLQGEIAGQIRALLGQPAYDQQLFDEIQRARRIAALKQCGYGDADPVARHEAWMAAHVAAGWVYGPEFNPDKKEHNNLLPWDQLPADAKTKVTIFALVARATVGLLTSIAAHEASHENHDTCGGCTDRNCD